MKSDRVTEQLKDRRDLRAMLIQKREDLERRISEVEAQIRKLTEERKEAA